MESCLSAVIDVIVNLMQWYMVRREWLRTHGKGTESVCGRMQFVKFKTRAIRLQ